MDSARAPKPTHTRKAGGLRNQQCWINWDQSLTLKRLCSAGCFRYSFDYCSLSLFLFSNRNQADSSPSIREATGCLAAEAFGLYWLSTMRHTRKEAYSSLLP